MDTRIIKKFTLAIQNKDFNSVKKLFNEYNYLRVLINLNDFNSFYKVNKNREIEYSTNYLIYKTEENPIELDMIFGGYFKYDINLLVYFAIHYNSESDMKIIDFLLPYMDLNIGIPFPEEGRELSSRSCKGRWFFKCNSYTPIHFIVLYNNIVLFRRVCKYVVLIDSIYDYALTESLFIHDSYHRLVKLAKDTKNFEMMDYFKSKHKEYSFKGANSVILKTLYISAKIFTYSMMISSTYVLISMSLYDYNSFNNRINDHCSVDKGYSNLSDAFNFYQGCPNIQEIIKKFPLNSISYYFGKNFMMKTPNDLKSRMEKNFYESNIPDQKNILESWQVLKRIGLV